MEIIVILAVVGVLFWWFFLRENNDYNKTTEQLVTPQKDEVANQQTVTESVKLEVAAEPALVPDSGPAKCGCGRSPTGYCVGLHALSLEDWAAHPDNPVKPVVALVEEAKPATKRTPAKKKSVNSKQVASKKAKPAARTARPKTKKA